MINHIFRPILLLVIVCACNKSNDQADKDQPAYAKRLVISPNSIAIEIDSLTVNRSTQLAYYHESKDWLFNLNWKTNEIQMYDLEDKPLIKR